MAKPLLLLPIDKHEVAPRIRAEYATRLAAQFYHNYPRPHRLTRLIVKGDSMRATLQAGDQLIIDSGLRPINSSVIVIDIDGHRLIKRLSVTHFDCPCSRRIPPIRSHHSLERFKCKGDGLLLQPDNPIYSPTPLSVIGRFTLVGVAVAVIRAVDFSLVM